MNCHLEEHNIQQGQAIVEELIAQGVERFFLAPGSRCTPLTIAIAEHPHTKTLVHFDERGLGFCALGSAKAQNAPVAIVVTSGTAVANLYPAIVEASMDNVPLIILAADRPSEMRDIGCSQTIPQVHIFGPYLRWEVDIPASDAFYSTKLMQSTVAQACYRTQQNPSGPVLLNLMFREPLFSLKNPTPCISQNTAPYNTYYGTQRIMDPKELDLLAKELETYENGWIVAGQLETQKDIESILTLSVTLSWPIVADVLSQLRNLGPNDALLSHFNHILQTMPLKEQPPPQALLMLGSHIVSKRVLQYISDCSPAFVLHVANFPQRHDPCLCVTHRIEMPPAQFAQSIQPHLSPRGPTLWQSQWQKRAQTIERALVAIVQKESRLTEPFVFIELPKIAPPSTAYFFSNSLSIRYADSFFFPQQSVRNCFANRGASGIDGILATALGVALTSSDPLVCIIGDLAFLHDLNTLLLIQKCAVPLTIILLNNQGGGIFQFLPIAKKTEIFGEYFETQHAFCAEKLSKSLDIPYTNPTTKEEYTQALKESLAQPGPQILEIFFDSKQSFQWQQEIEEQLRNNLQRASQSVLSFPQ